MSPNLCSRGADLFAAATRADEAFKTRLVEFFSSTLRNDLEMARIEELGAEHREADEAFERHRRFCETCAGSHVSVARYADESSPKP